MTTFKADLDGAIFAYDYCARLAYVMTFDHPQVHRCHLQYSTMSYMNIVGLIYMTWSDMKSRLWYPVYPWTHSVSKYHVMFTIKNCYNYQGSVCIVDITSATRKTNTCCKKRKIKRRLKKIKSRREEEANGENTSEIRSEQERRNYQEQWTLYRPRVRKQNYTKRRNQQHKQKFKSQLSENHLE